MECTVNQLLTSREVHTAVMLECKKIPNFFSEAESIDVKSSDNIKQTFKVRARVHNIKSTLGMSSAVIHQLFLIHHYSSVIITSTS